MASYKILLSGMGSGSMVWSVPASPTSGKDAAAKAKAIARMHRERTVLVYRSTVYGYGSWKAWRWEPRRNQPESTSVPRTEWEANKPSSEWIGTQQKRPT